MQGVFKIEGVETKFADDGVFTIIRSGDLELRYFSGHSQYRRDMETTLRDYNDFCADRLKPCEVVAFPKR